MSWNDANEIAIKAGDILSNPFNQPRELEVLEDSDGNLYLGDMDTPFDDKYQFDCYWTIVHK